MSPRSLMVFFPPSVPLLDVFFPYFKVTPCFFYLSHLFLFPSLAWPTRPLLFGLPPPPLHFGINFAVRFTRPTFFPHSSTLVAFLSATTPRTSTPHKVHPIAPPSFVPLRPPFYKRCMFVLTPFCLPIHRDWTEFETVFV